MYQVGRKIMFIVVSLNKRVCMHCFYIGGPYFDLENKTIQAYAWNLIISP